MTPEENENARKILLERANAILHVANFLDTTQQQNWKTYRNALQDMDTTVEFPVFPATPDEPVYPFTVGQVTERTEIANNLQVFAAQYQAAIDRLQQIENAGNQPFTLAGFNTVQSAVRDEAKYIRLMAQALKKLLT